MTNDPLREKANFESVDFGERFDSSLSPLRLLERTASAYGDRSAISFQLLSGAKARSETLTWNELLFCVRRCSNLFHSLAGSGSPIALLLPNCNEMVVCTMSAMTSGIVCPINPLLEPDHIAALLRESGAKVLVTMRSFPKTDLSSKARLACADAPNVKTLLEVDFLHYLVPPSKWIVPLIRPKVPKSSIEVLDFSTELSKHSGESLSFSESSDNRITCYFHTGGTTGLPKIAQHRRSGLFYNGWLGETMLMKHTDVVMTPIPLFHVFAAYAIWLSCLCSGAHMVLPTPAGYRGEGVFDNFWKLIERWQATFLATVPTAVAALMQRPINADVSTLEYAFCGSAALPVETFRDFQESTGVRILEGYGLTESTCLVSVNPPLGEKKIGSVGIPFPYCDVRIFHCDPDTGSVTKECGVDEVGEICISNPGVMVNETYTDASKNVALYANDTYLRSGDLGRLDSDGYLWITGRAKDLIIRGGHNIDPALIEESLSGHPSVSFVGAIGQPDSKLGELPCAYVELKSGMDISVSTLLDYAGEHIPERAAVPVHIEILPELPKTAVGKVFKPDLRRRAITRVYNDALTSAGIDSQVVEVIEDKKLGLVACLSRGSSISDDDITSVLGGFITKWRWAGEGVD